MNRLMRGFCTVLCGLMMVSTVHADTLVLPSGLTAVDDEAFAGNTSLTEVVVPDGVEILGAGAFSDCSSLRSVTIPDSVEAIGSGCFAGAAPAMLMHTVPNSAAAYYALANEIDFDANTTFRALTIGQTYENHPTLNHLVAPAYDGTNLEHALQLDSRSWQVTKLYNLTADEIHAAIRSTFAGATVNDVSLFYYSGHGGSGGTLMGMTGSITPYQLRQTLDQIPGRKIVILDCCHSGGMISRSGTMAVMSMGADVRAANSAVIAAFSGGGMLRSRSATDLAASPYLVMTACRSEELSYEWKGRYGLYTYYLCMALGYNIDTASGGIAPADADGDDVVTFEEAYRFANENAYNITSPYGIVQDAQMYPSNANWFGLRR